MIPNPFANSDHRTAQRGPRSGRISIAAVGLLVVLLAGGGLAAYFSRSSLPRPSEGSPSETITPDPATAAAVVPTAPAQPVPSEAAMSSPHRTFPVGNSDQAVSVAVFDKQGELVRVNAQKVELEDAEWESRLTPETYKIARAKGTERPFCGTLLDNKKEGVYTCVCCGLPLFASSAKFNSGTGWPSFFQPIAEGNVSVDADVSYGMVREEILCARCDCHLGHVFDDGPPPTGKRYCLNSASLEFTDKEHLATLADPIAETSRSGNQAAADTNDDAHLLADAGDQKGAGPATATDATPSGQARVAAATAIFAGGCFWCTEAAFEQFDGVLDVESGYIGGKRETANYEAVCNGNTGHAEAIRITYDPLRVSYQKLLDIFFDAHDPTQLNRQGADVGTQYRSAIFPANDREKSLAETTIKKLNDAKIYARPIVTTIEPQKEFYPAEAYHQDYARQNPTNPYIRAKSTPKAMQVREKYKSLLPKK